jgi:hypothetical protein
MPQGASGLGWENSDDFNGATLDVKPAHATAKRSHYPRNNAGDRWYTGAGDHWVIRGQAVSNETLTSGQNLLTLD